MESNVIALQLLENIKKGEVGFGELIIAAKKYIEDNVRVNAELILAMADESQFYDVVDKMLLNQWSNDTLEKLVKLPGILELIDGSIINKYREPTQIQALALVDKLLDKLFGAQWFEHIQSIAKSAITISEK